ncbi:MAG: hypothetical protein H8D49_01790 [Dehalococcoidia bacterium]|nr:hypothetical protein [Dehalococcoidia bacterium]
MVKTVLDREDLAFDPPELGCVFCLSGLPGGGSIAYDRSPHGNHGNITGATWVRLSSGLWCLSFDGVDDYVDCNNDVSLSLEDGFTIELWENVDSSAYYRWFISKGDPATFTQNYGIILLDNNNIYGLVRNVDDDTTWGAYFGVSGGSGWHFLAMSFDITHIVHYADGVGATPVATGTQAHTNNRPVRLGYHYSKKISGYLALPRIYNRPLSALEIQNHFNQEKHLFGVW